MGESERFEVVFSAGSTVETMTVKVNVEMVESKVERVTPKYQVLEINKKYQIEDLVRFEGPIAHIDFKNVKDG